MKGIDIPAAWVPSLIDELPVIFALAAMPMAIPHNTQASRRRRTEQASRPRADAAIIKESGFDQKLNVLKNRASSEK